MGITDMKHRQPLIQSVMFDMIVYVSTPFLLEHQDTKNIAIARMNKFLGKFYKANPRWCAVNALYSIYNNPLLEDAATYKNLYSTAGLLIRGSQMHVTLKAPGWEYSELVLNERHLAMSLNLPMIEADENVT